MRNYPQTGSSDLRIVSEISTTEPVNLQEVKAYFRTKNTQDDAVLIDPLLITNARRMAEKYLCSDIVPKQREVYYTYLSEPINLYYAPVDSITEVTIDGEAKTTDDYELEGLDNPLFSIVEGPAEKVKISYETKGVINAEIKMGILELCYILYYSRGEKLANNWKSWLSPFKIFGYYGVR